MQNQHRIIGGTRNAPNPPKYLLNKEHVFEVKLHNPINNDQQQFIDTRDE
jgi:hypothetical protein